MNPPEIKYLTDATGHPTAVVIPIELWHQRLPQDENAIADLADRLEDYCLDKAMTAAQNTPLLNAEHIEITPGVCGGKPRIAGHRIRVQDIVIWYERLKLSPAEIVVQYPSITLADVHTALAYYYDHQADIQQAIDTSETFANQMATQTSSILKPSH